LIECEVNLKPSFNTLSLKNNLKKYVDQEINKGGINKISLYYRDLNNGPWFGIDEREFFSPASLTKVPLMMAYYLKAEQNSSILQKKIKCQSLESYEAQNFSPEQKLELGQKYTIDELISRMVKSSDNVALNMLLDNVSEKEANKVFSDLGISVSKTNQDPEGDFLSVKNYASFFRVLYNASYLNNEMSEKALELLSQSSYTRALRAGIPKEIVVAHKFGERKYLDTGERQLHDCGVVYHQKSPFLLCVMTRGDNFDTLNRIIKEIASLTYQQID